MSANAEATASRLTEAFTSGDLALLGPLLAADVRWGGEEETEQTCHSRSDVLSWYGQLQAAGVSAQITDTLVRDDAVVLTLELAGRDRGPDGPRPDVVHQVFRLSEDGLIADIRGFPQRELALAVADTPVRLR
jgi:hypothetical protein